MNQQLYNELYQLRQKIKERERKTQGRTPTVCTDDSLYEMTQLCPKKFSDFESVSGIGKAFIDNYGNEFLNVILKYVEVKTEKKINISNSVADTLKELEKKLVNVNRRNRLLYMPKLSNKYAFDMHEFGKENLCAFLFDKTPSLTLANIDEPTNNDYESESIRFKKIAQLLREVNKDLRDKGQNDFYIGYPYVIGRVPGEDFDVRAPLVLFPVSAEKTATSIKLYIDDTRDTIFNNTFVLAYYKFNNITEPLPSEVFENYSDDTFITDMLNFFDENKIHIKQKDFEFCKFNEYKLEEFPKFNNGELYLENCAVLGKFPICSNSIQKDFEEIIKNSEINTLLNDLLSNSEDADYNIEIQDEKNIDTEENEFDISDKKMVYINDLNSSQERVLSAINSCNELVVQGPPGTGKSQVITSLISEFVSNEKTVLMVSEKKTALDVVYSRLGNLSRYALLIDDVGNKSAFYEQLSNMLTLGKTADTVTDLSSVSENIDATVVRLENIANKLYKPNNFGIEPYKLYIKNKRYDLSNEDDRNIVDKIVSNRDSNLLNIKYDKLENIHHQFENANFCDNLEKYVNITTNYPWINNVLSDLSEYDLIDLVNKLKSISQLINEWKIKNAIVRVFTKQRILKDIDSKVCQFFVNSHRDFYNFIFDNIEKIIEGIGSYITYQELKPLYDGLEKTERIYARSILNIKEVTSFSLIEANDELYNELLFEHICRFEAKNRSLLNEINDFGSIIKRISELIENKQMLSKERIKSLLAAGMYNISCSKRHGEILRAVESKRKMSVNKFVKKFDFELFKAVKIWLLTPEVVSEIIPLQTGVFDLVVFDEASQMYVEKGIPAILRAKKVVVAGDHKQLRPSNLGAGRIEIDFDELPEDAEITAALEEESLLDLARFKYNDVLLNFHYRSKYEELIAFSNHAFYKGRLYVSPNVAPPICPPIEVHKMENATWVNRTNVEEAKYIVEMLKQFFANRRENETIGIITFNTNQRDLIDDLIDEECAINPQFANDIRTELTRKQNGEDIGFFVKNIESVQGDERDVIIFSIGYAKNENGKLIRNFGWLNQKGGENRLNVAISRAKKKVHIVTSFNPAELQVEDTKNDGPRILKKYLEYAFAVSSGDKNAAKTILKSFGEESLPDDNISFDCDFENQVYNALTAFGYTVDTHVGIGGYNIDLAIKKNGKYILGIECDGRLYQNSKSARERDYHRQKYLESRGWKIHRVWSINWWKNPKQEMEKIIAIVDSIS